MEKIIWVLSYERAFALDMQRQINFAGSMRALCILSEEALDKIIESRLGSNEQSISMPSAILIDYEMFQHTELLKRIEGRPELAGVPVFFILENADAKVEEECYKKGAMVVLHKPITASGIMRIEHAAWQYEVTKKYERILQKQTIEIQTAKEIQRLNQQLESRNEFLYRIFGKYFSDEVLEVIMKRPEGACIGGERCEIAILMADLRGFSAVAEVLDAKEVTELLDCFFEKMIEVILEFGGTIIEFMGDGLLAIFGAPIERNDYRERAIAAAIRMQNSMKAVNEYLTQRGYEALEMGIGVHCGEVFVGNVGSDKMMRYNVLGRVVNECSRIEGCSIGGQVLASKDIVKDLSCSVRIAREMEIAVKGIEKSVVVCDIKGMDGKYSCYITDEELSMIKKVEEPVILELNPINNKMLTADSVKVLLQEFSSKMLVVECNVTDVELFAECEDVKIFKADDIWRKGFCGVYAKVIQKEGKRLWLQFTHTNYQLKEYLLDLQSLSAGKGLIMDSSKYCTIEIKKTTVFELEKLIASNGDGIEGCQLLWSESEEGIKFVFNSSKTSIRALEFMDYLVGEYAMVHGNKEFAHAMVSNILLQVMLSEMEMCDVKSMLDKKVSLYYSECDWIHADDFVAKNKEEILKLPIYVKKRLAWAYVRTEDIVPTGKKFSMKSLENESELIMEASEDSYIMIGCRGEIYDIKREKFEKTYEESEESLDVLQQMLDFIPEVQSYPEREFISLEEYAHLCYPQNTGGIYVTCLKKRTKVFTTHNNGEYFVGRQGDYLAIREDDLTDMYIIQREIFMQTYEEKGMK